MNQLTIAQVEQVNPLTDSILQVMLKPEKYIDYQAGQYLQIISADEELSYSIANAPLGSHHYELHIRHSQENVGNQQLLADIRKKGAVRIRVPLGSCHLTRLSANKPILFIAGGTGFAPIKAMIEQLLATGDKRSFELFWGARSQSDLYMDEKVMQWQAHVEHFRYFSLLSNTSKETLASVILDHHANHLQNWQIVIAGPFDMVYVIRDVLLRHGVKREQLFSDAFDFETKGSE
ncbi:CDP-6-deoxy-delta-3,4-glucoseen reductase [Legionella lansingensis]|uniref:CDP-6-deoxy-delta-3,4-glucoseen reductase n=1 Tax=Legionella lansingensis TaxID=45067 RepID=A0A0W0VEX7_9GAMM|nr:NAD(P)H-flavin reductase [Legionella lansingensis]KTD18691.1 CDP-6-deoxy-delta-3,4-glucoseen reductase [Legionella lansingensis]SNV57343.1 CDP-6-deoxy-delta-3,4-glucoseen reductase [Legionella lansingensis]